MEYAQAFNTGYDDYPENKNPFEQSSILHLAYEDGFHVAEYYAQNPPLDDPDPGNTHT